MGGQRPPRENFGDYVRPFPNFTGGVFTCIYAYFLLKGANFASKGAKFALNLVKIENFSRLASLGDNF